MNTPQAPHDDYQTVARAVNYIAQHRQDQPDLASLACHLQLSSPQCEQLFKRWAGVSPQRFMQYLHKTHVRQRLIESAAEEADFGNDLNTNSGLADLQVSCEALTPKKYQRQVQNLNVRYGWHPSPFGPCFIAISQRGIVKLAFAEKEGKETIQQEFQQEWGVANCRQDSGATASLLREIFAMRDTGQPIHLLLKGTHFQLKVWLALLKVPLGQLTTYARLAQQIEQPQGVRAVGSAVAKNPIAFLIPCHRVIRKSGEIHHYRWGTERKHALIGWEQARNETRSLPPDGSPG